MISNKNRIAWIGMAACCLLSGYAAAQNRTQTDRASSVELTDAQTPWRAYLVLSGAITRTGGQLTLSVNRKSLPLNPATADPAEFGLLPPPRPDWAKPEFDDHAWPRYGREELDEFLGGYGAAVEANSPGPTVLYLRTCFGIADPAKAADLKLSLSFLGGCAAYVNGEEIGRAHLPPGSIAPLTPAEDYSIEAYTMADGATPLPPWDKNAKPAADVVSRYQKRVRTLTVNVPARVLVRGRNVVAVELHRAPSTGPGGGRPWSHVGIRDIGLTSATGAGAIVYAQVIQGTHVWSANAVDQVTETPPENPCSTGIGTGTWFGAAACLSVASNRGTPSIRSCR